MFVLLVEHNPERARAIAATLEAAGVRVEPRTSSAEALAALARPGPPDLILIEEHMPDMPALEFLRHASRMSVSSAVVVLGLDEDHGAWVEAARSGVLDYVTLDDSDAYLTTLVARLNAAYRRTSSESGARRLADALGSTSSAVLLIDRRGRLEFVNPAGARLLGKSPAALDGVTLSDLVSGSDSRRRADLLAAADVAGEWAGEIEIQRPDGERVPCMANVSPVRREDGSHEGVVLTLRDVADRVAIEDALRAANRRLSEQASRDHLTRLYNRGYFMEVLARETARSGRYGDRVTILMADLDGFKRVNDELGHEVGDRVLAEIARLLPEGVRTGDVVARYGGDEFCVLLPNASEEDARIVAERLRAQVAEAGSGRGDGIRVTLSIGMDTSPDVRDGQAIDAGGMLRRADRALLEAKRRGGNQVVSFHEAGSTRR